MYRYTSAPPQHSYTYLQPPSYPHNLTARSYDTTYMSRPYSYTEPRRYNSYYETSYTRPSTSYRPVQTETWRHVRPAAQAPHPDKTPRKSSLKKTASRHVHFDLPPAQGTLSRTIRIAEEERQRERDRVRAREREREREREDRYIPVPRPPLRRDSEERMPRKQQQYTYTSTYEYDSHLHQHRERHRTSSSPPRNTLPRSTSYHTSPRSRSTAHTPPSPPSYHQPQLYHEFYTPIPSRPTVYIITYATDLLRSESSVANLLSTQLPRRIPPIPHLYTIDARGMRPPSPSLCAQYSGVSPLIQDIVMEDGDAQRAARTAVNELLRFGEEGRGRRGYARGGGRGGGGGGMEVSLSVCCHAGTHRSVAIAERIAQCVKSEVARMGCDEGVRVVCRHVHRVKGRRDPF